jgi:hypothetical protein
VRGSLKLPFAVAGLKLALQGSTLTVSARNLLDTAEVFSNLSMILSEIGDIMLPVV